MKKIMNLFLLAFAVLLFVPMLTSCNYEEPNYPADHRFQVIKFAKPEYKQYVVTNAKGVYHQDDDDYFLAAKWRQHVPYIELDEDYLLVDWRLSWLLFNSNPKLVDKHWEDLVHWKETWKEDELLPVDSILQERWLMPYTMFMAYAKSLDFTTITYVETYFDAKPSPSHSIDYNNDIDKLEKYCDEKYAELVPLLNNVIANEGLKAAQYKVDTIYWQYFNYTASQATGEPVEWKGDYHSY